MSQPIQCGHREAGVARIDSTDGCRTSPAPPLACFAKRRDGLGRAKLAQIPTACRGNGVRKKARSRERELRQASGCPLTLRAERAVNRGSVPATEIGKRLECRSVTFLDQTSNAHSQPEMIEKLGARSYDFRCDQVSSACVDIRTSFRNASRSSAGHPLRARSRVMRSNDPRRDGSTTSGRCFARSIPTRKKVPRACDDRALRAGHRCWPQACSDAKPNPRAKRLLRAL